MLFPYVLITRILSITTNVYIQSMTNSNNLPMLFTYTLGSISFILYYSQQHVSVTVSCGLGVQISVPKIWSPTALVYIFLFSFTFPWCLRKTKGFTIMLLHIATATYIFGCLKNIRNTLPAGMRTWYESVS